MMWGNGKIKGFRTEKVYPILHRKRRMSLSLYQTFGTSPCFALQQHGGFDFSRGRNRDEVQKSVYSVSARTVEAWT